MADDETPATAWSTATRRCKFTRRLARLIAAIGDLPATSAFSYHLSSAHPPDRGFYRGASDEEALITKLVERSARYNGRSSTPQG